VGCAEVVAAQQLVGARPVRAAVHQGGDHDRGIRDNGHRRSAPRWERIHSFESLLAVLALRSRILRKSASGSGRRASSMSWARRYSWSDRPVRAARAANSSRVFGGTSRMVMDLAMPALCMLQQQNATADSAGAEGALQASNQSTSRLVREFSSPR